MLKNLFSVKQLQEWITGTPLGNQYWQMGETDNLEVVVSRLDQMMRVARLHNDVKIHRALLMAAGFALLIDIPFYSKMSTNRLVLNVLSLLDLKDPMSVHCHVEYVLEQMHLANTYADIKLYLLAICLLQISPRALPMAVCMIWSIVDRILGMGITMYRYHELQILAEALAASSTTFSGPELTEDKAISLDLMLQGVCRILQFVILTNNDELMQFGYSERFFTMRPVDIQSMMNWAETLRATIPDQSSWSGLIVYRLDALIALLNRIETVQNS